MGIKTQNGARRKWDYLKRKLMRSTNAWTANALMDMTNWSWDESKCDEIDAYDDIEQKIEGCIEMNRSETINLRELGVLWYRCGLRDRYATLRSNIMTSETRLTGEFVLGRVKELKRVNNMGQPAEKASYGRAKSNMKCFNCQLKGHLATPTGSEDIPTMQGMAARPCCCRGPQEPG